MNHNDIVELLNTHSTMRVSQAALRAAHDTIVSRMGEEFAGPSAEEGKRTIVAMKESAQRLEFDIAEVEGEIVQTITDLEARVKKLEADLEAARNMSNMW